MKWSRSGFKSSKGGYSFFFLLFREVGKAIILFWWKYPLFFDRVLPYLDHIRPKPHSHFSFIPNMPPSRLHFFMCFPCSFYPLIFLVTHWFQLVACWIIGCSCGFDLAQGARRRWYVTSLLSREFSSPPLSYGRMMIWFFFSYIVWNSKIPSLHQSGVLLSYSDCKIKINK